MNRYILCKTHNQTTFAAASVGVMLKYLAPQQGLFNLNESQLIGLALNFRMIGVDILISTHSGFYLINIHTSTNPSLNLMAQSASLEI